MTKIDELPLEINRMKAKGRYVILGKDMGQTMDEVTQEMIDGILKVALKPKIDEALYSTLPAKVRASSPRFLLPVHYKA